MAHNHYQQEDSQLALALKDAIERAFDNNVNVFVSSHEDDLELGDDWFKELMQNIKEADAMILLITSDSVQRPWINFEAGGGWMSNSRIIPLCAKGFEVVDLPSPFGSRQGLSLVSEENHETLIRNIASFAGLDVPEFSFEEVIAQNTIEDTIDVEEHPVKDGSIDSPKLLPILRSDEVFERRLGDAFPGLRDVEVIDNPIEALNRLEIVLREPLKGGGKSYTYPFWWYRGPRDGQIEVFRRKGNDICLLGFQELKIRRLVAVRVFPHSGRNFLYIETTGQVPPRCYEYNQDQIQSQLSDSQTGFVDIEFGVWNDYEITREEYDDGSAMINGKPTTLQDAELRIRYLTPYNVIITSKYHVLNDSKTNQEHRTLMNRILREETDIEELIRFIQSAPRTPRMKLVDAAR